MELLDLLLFLLVHRSESISSSPLHISTELHYNEKHHKINHVSHHRAYHHHHHHFSSLNENDSLKDSYQNPVTPPIWPFPKTGNSTDFINIGNIISESRNDNIPSGCSEEEAFPKDEALEHLPLRLPIWGIVILVIGYALVFLLGVVGNCSVLFIVIRFRRMKTVTNYFIFSLAVADLLVLLFCLLPNLVSNIFLPWVLGRFLCKTVPYIQGVSVCASIYFLVAISLERCIAIQWPFKYQITKEKAKLVICAIWLWSCIVALPWALFFQLGKFVEEYPHLDFCIEVWPESYQKWQTYYFLFGNLFLCYVFPLGVILLCYLTIWFRVYRRPVPSDCYHKAMELIYQRSKTAVIKMLIVVVLIFALSFCPLYAILLRLEFGSEAMSELEMTMIHFVYPIAQWLLCFNSSINPIIYSFLNNKFRKAFTGIIWGYKRKNRVKIKHKSPTVNILLKRFSSYRVETIMSNNNNHHHNNNHVHECSYDSI